MTRVAPAVHLMHPPLQLRHWHRGNAELNIELPFSCMSCKEKYIQYSEQIFLHLRLTLTADILIIRISELKSCNLCHLGTNHPTGTQRAVCVFKKGAILLLHTTLSTLPFILKC